MAVGGNLNDVATDFAGAFAGQSNLVEPADANSGTPGSGESAGVFAGVCNTVHGRFAAAVAGGRISCDASNIVWGLSAAAVGGWELDVGGQSAVAIAGRDNVVDSTFAAAVGGEDASVTQAQSVSIGGTGAQTSQPGTEKASVVIGGSSNQVSADGGVVIGGAMNHNLAEPNCVIIGGSETMDCSAAFGVSFP